MPHTNGEWFKLLHEKRSLPGHCGRCGNPNPDKETHKTCAKCRGATSAASRRRKAVADEYARMWKSIANIHRRIGELKSIQVELLAVKKMLAAVGKRLDSHDLALARVDISTRRNFQRAYQKGYKAGEILTLKKDCDESYLDALPSITKQELSTMNHAYDSLAHR
jgi:hypothetical protein